MLFDPNNISGGEFASFAEATQFLEQMCPVLRVRHLSYWSLSLSEGLPDEVTWIATYDPAYMSYYMGHYTPLGDPVFDATGAEREVIDWVEFSASDESAQAMHRAAANYGIGRFGLSFPFIDGPNRSIMFSVNAACDDAGWPGEKRRIIDPFRGFARYFHGRAKSLVESRNIGSVSAA